MTGAATVTEGTGLSEWSVIAHRVKEIELPAITDLLIDLVHYKDEGTLRLTVGYTGMSLSSQYQQITDPD